MLKKSRSRQFLSCTFFRLTRKRFGDLNDFWDFYPLGLAAWAFALLWTRKWLPLLWLFHVFWEEGNWLDLSFPGCFCLGFYSCQRYFFHLKWLLLGLIESLRSISCVFGCVRDLGNCPSMLQDDEKKLNWKICQRNSHFFSNLNTIFIVDKLTFLHNLRDGFFISLGIKKSQINCIVLAILLKNKKN